LRLVYLMKDQNTADFPDMIAWSAAELNLIATEQ
jgi:hypothetical protein